MIHHKSKSWERVLLRWYVHGQRCRKHFESGGCVSTFFLIFCQFQKVGGVTKSRPIDPFFDVIYLFLNVRFGQKVFKFTVFGPMIYVLHVPFNTFCRQLKLFHSISLNFFDHLCFCTTPHFPFNYILKIFTHPLKIF